MLNIIFKLPRTEKFSIGNEYKDNMYKMLEDILMLSKIDSEGKLKILNRIDARLNLQRIFLRIMNDNHWIDEKKFKKEDKKIKRKCKKWNNDIKRLFHCYVI